MGARRTSRRSNPPAFAHDEGGARRAGSSASCTRAIRRSTRRTSADHRRAARRRRRRPQVATDAARRSTTASIEILGIGVGDRQAARARRARSTSTSTSTSTSARTIGLPVPARGVAGRPRDLQADRRRARDDRALAAARDRRRLLRDRPLARAASTSASASRSTIPADWKGDGSRSGLVADRPARATRPQATGDSPGERPGHSSSWASSRSREARGRSRRTVVRSQPMPADLRPRQRVRASRSSTPEAESSKVYEPVIGVVTDNKDPTKLGRVKVKIPILSDDDTTFWAPIIMLGAGKNRGWFFIPETDDEVLVMFEHGDLNRPLIVGSLWNGKDKPPPTRTPAATRARVIKSRAGLEDHVRRRRATEDHHRGRHRQGQDHVRRQDTTRSPSRRSTATSASSRPTGDMTIVAKSIELKATTNLEIHAGSTMAWGTDTTATINGVRASRCSGSNGEPQLRQRAARRRRRPPSRKTSPIRTAS